MIKMQVIGNLGKDCVTNTVNGKNVINFSVAHKEKFKDSSGQPKEKTTWVDCAYWTDRVGIVPYLKKGTQVYVEGSPEVRSFLRNDGTPGASLTMRVSNIQLLGSGSRQEVTVAKALAWSESQGGIQSAPADFTEPVDDLPF